MCSPHACHGDVPVANDKPVCWGSPAATVMTVLSANGRNGKHTCFLSAIHSFEIVLRLLRTKPWNNSAHCPHHTLSWLQVFLPAARQHLRPPMERATDGSVIQLASLEQLYKVFERC